MKDISKNYITIQGWMISDLHLSGNNLLIFALIFGFCQNCGGTFNGTHDYMANWINASRLTVIRTISKLIELGLIEKQIQGMMKHNIYSVNHDIVNLMIQKARQERLECEKKAENKKDDVRVAKVVKGDINAIKAKLEHDIAQSQANIEALEANNANNDEDGNFELEPVEPEIEVVDEAKRLRLDTWNKFSSAYKQRYGIEPLRNAKVNSQIKAFCEMVGNDAPLIAEFFVTHNNKWFVLKGHDFGILLANAQVVVKDYYSGRKTTTGVAKRQDEYDDFNERVSEAIRMLDQKYDEDGNIRPDWKGF